VVSYPSRFLDHREPVITLSDRDGNTPATLNALFQNCIIWGESEAVESEVGIDRIGNNGTINFNQVLWKMKTIPPGITITPPEPINNQPPQFDSVNVSENYYDFRLNNRNSLAVDKGMNAGIPIDFDGKPRPVGPKPDLGCFEKQ
jgi:hypothetical protein